MRQKRMVCQNLLFTSKLGCFMNFHGSSLEFTAHLVPYASHTSCKFGRNCSTGFDFIRNSMGPVFIETACMFLNRINKNETLSLVLYKYVYKFLIISLMHMKANQSVFTFLSYI